MAISDAIGVRHVRCPKCHSVLQEPSDVPVYQCGGCGTSLRAKTRTGNTQDAVVSAPSSESVLPPPRRSQSRHLGSGDVASTSASTPGAQTTVHHQGADTTSRRETGDLVPATKHHASAQAPTIVDKKGHGRSANREADGSSEPHRGRGAVSASNVSVNFSRGSRDAAELQDSEMRREAEPEPDAGRKKGSGEAARRRTRDVEEAAPMSARATDSQSAPAVLNLKRRDDAAAPVPAVAEGKAPSPPRHVLQPQKLSPLHEKILKTVDELKGDLSELFSKSPEIKPRTPARPPRLPKQEGHVSRPAIPTSRARHAAVHRRGIAGHAGKPGQAAPRGLPSRRYRRCRADPCGHNARPARPCRRSCCDHDKPECGSCRAHCCVSGAQEPARLERPPAAVEVKWRAAPPRHHCRPVLKGAPFIVCSSCFALVQVPADFVVSSAKVRELRCGSCSAVLSYSYRDPNRKKPPPPQCTDQYSTDGSSEARHGEGGARPDLFSFVEDFAAAYGASYSAEDEQPLHVSRNSPFDTVDEINMAETAPQSTSLHRLMGYGSARELLLLRRSPSLYEYGSFDERTTPPDASRRYGDRKGKGVCVDADDDVVGDDDSDDEGDGGALKRSNVRGAGWTHGRGVPGPGAIRIRS